MTSFDATLFTTPELLECFAQILDELKNRRIVRTRNNPVGDYAEWLVARRLGLTLQANSARAYDAVGPSGERYQIKSRRIAPANPVRQLGVIRNLVAHDFDCLIAVLFDQHFCIAEAYQIPHGIIEKYAVYRPHVNGHVLQLKGAILHDPAISDITALLDGKDS